jgi:hypothetical protein
LVCLENTTNKGGGACYDFLDLWIINFKGMLSAHYFTGPQFLDMITSSLNAIVEFSLPIPVVLLNLYANFGYELTYLGTELIQNDKGEDYYHLRNGGRLAAGLLIGFDWIALGYEYSIFFDFHADGQVYQTDNEQNHAISLGIYF